MPTLADLIDPDARQKVRLAVTEQRATETAMIAKVTANEPAKANEPVTIGPHKQGALTDALCQNCTEPIKVPAGVPEGMEHAERVFLCPDCAPAYLAANPVDLVRNSDPERPLTVTTRNKENRMPFNLDNLSDAELGALASQHDITLLGRIVRARMLEQGATDLPEKQKKAKKKAKAKEEADLKARKAEQKERQARPPLPEIVVSNSLTVPALDLSEVTSTDEVVSAALRSPYNKARFRLFGEKALPSPQACEEDASLTPTTYAVIAQEHIRIAEAVAAKANAPKKEKKAKKKAEPEVEAALVAEVSIDDEARVEALVKTLGVSKKKARKLLAAL